MKRFFKIIGIIVGVIAVLVGITFAVVLYATGTEREIAKKFIFDVSSGKFEDARASLHPTIAKQLTLEKLTADLANVQPYTEVSFSNMQTSSGRAELSGTARTADGCASGVEFELIEDLITSFNISPMCIQP